MRRVIFLVSLLHSLIAFTQSSEKETIRFGKKMKPLSTIASSRFYKFQTLLPIVRTSGKMRIFFWG